MAGKLRKVLKILIVPVILGLLFSGCSAQNADRRELFAMDTVMTLTAYGSKASDALDAAEAELFRLDALLSVTNTGSEVYALNRSGGGEMSPDLAALTRRSVEIFEMSGGAFDATICPLSEGWGFYSDDQRVPDEAEIAELLSLVGSDMLSLSGESVAFGTPGMALDFGGIAKGFASQRVIDILREGGVSSAVVSLGGNVHTLGTKPDGSLWRIAIQSPWDSEDYIGILSCSDTAVVTSGGYQRYFEQDGRVYHHILDPSTGYPSDSDLVSVTIVCPDSVLADGLSTALFVMGLEGALEFWRGSQSFDMILVSADESVYITSNIASSFSSQHQFEEVLP